MFSGTVGYLQPVTEHRNVPVLTIDPRDSRPGWQQFAAILTEAIRSGLRAPGNELPSITELSALRGIATGVIRHAPGGARRGQPRHPAARPRRGRRRGSPAVIRG